MARNSTTTAKDETVTETAETVETAETAKPARIKRSPRERAQLKLDAANKRLTKANERKAKFANTMQTIERDIADAQAEVNFRSQSSHLSADASNDVPADAEDDASYG